MAHSRTAKKNIRKSEKRRLHNRTLNSAMRTQLKKLRTAIDAGNAAEAQAELPRTQKLIDKAAKNNRIHPNKAARTKSRLAKEIAALGAK